MRYPKSEPAIDGRAITGARETRDPRSREYAVQTMFCLKGFLDSKTFSAKHAEVGRLIQLGRPVPSDVRELGQHGGDRKSKAARNQVRDDTNLIHSSDTALYIVARLDRYRPDLAARVRAHELSANAAAIEAGRNRLTHSATWMQIVSGEYLCSSKT